MADALAQMGQRMVAAYRELREADRFRPILFTAPTVASARQWERRFLRGIDRAVGFQFTAPSPPEPPNPYLRLAAAGAALAEGAERYEGLRRFPETLMQVAYAYGVVQGLTEADRAFVEPEFLAICAAMDRRLTGETTSELPNGSFIHSAAPDAVSVPLPHDPDLAAEGRRRLETGQGLQVVEAYDAIDEVAVALSQIQDWLGEGIPPEEIGVVISTADPYRKLFALMAMEFGLTWNGTASQCLAETPVGQRLRDIPLPDDWASLRDKFQAVTDGDESPAATEIRRQLAQWDGLPDLVATPEAPLANALRRTLLNQAAPAIGEIGDGFFLGLPGEATGLRFARMILVGVTHDRFPRPPGAHPFLPPGVGFASSEAQRRAFDGLVARGEETWLTFPKCDRRNGRESFPSIWIGGGPMDRRVRYPSSMALLPKLAGRTATATSLAEAIANGSSPHPGERLFIAWESDDVTQEAAVGRSLVPTDPISPSQLETFFGCPRRWYFRYAQGLPEPIIAPAFGLSALDMGTAVHDALRDLFRSRWEPLSRGGYVWSEEDRATLHERLIDHATRRLGHPPIGPVLTEWRRWGRRLDQILDWDQAYRLAHRAVPAGIEIRLEGRVGDLAVMGRADRIDRMGDGSLNVIDYKTGKGASSGKASDPIAGGTRLQGLLYAELAANRYKESASGAYWFFGRPVTKMEERQLLDEASRARMQTAVGVAKRMLEAGLVPMRPFRDASGRLCGTCPYDAICPVNREAIAARQAGGTSTEPFAEFRRLAEGEME